MRKAPVRMVCVNCLRSVELLLSDDVNSQLCPHCGGTIEVDESLFEPFDAEVNESDQANAPPMAEHHATVEWESNWERGSIGRLGRFHFRDRLGDGGFGQVYLAYDPRLDRDVAVKVLKQPRPSARIMERFFREARAAARLDNPNIVAVHDAGYTDGRCWVAYQLVNGRPLSWFRDQRRLEPAKVAKIIHDLAVAIEHAHRVGVVHRDLKPANVLLDEQGRPRLIDFGLARMFDVGSDLTRDGAVVGTPFYMSPEQALGFSSQVDERSDVYSLGVILLELLTGRQVTEMSSERSVRKFAAATSKPGSKPDAITANVAGNRVKRINLGQSSARATLMRICDKAMAPQPSDRYSSARELAEDLERWLDRQRDAVSRLSFSLACIVMGLMASVLLVVGLKAALPPMEASPQKVQAVPNQSPVAQPIVPESHSNPADKPADLNQPPAEPLASVPPIAISERFIGHKDTHKVHRPDHASNIGLTESKRVLFSSMAEAISAGFTACGTCRPHDLHESSLDAAVTTPSP
jgi:eukaryotic-like serine/threonine-protein kinase